MPGDPLMSQGLHDSSQLAVAHLAQEACAPSEQFYYYLILSYYCQKRFLSTYLSFKNPFFILINKLCCIEYRFNLIRISHNSSYYISVKAHTVLLQFLFSVYYCKINTSNPKVPERFSNIFTQQYCCEINQTGTDCCL